MNAKRFSGSLDDLRIYTRKLDSNELRETGVHYPIRALLSGLGGQPTKSDEERIRDYYLRRIAPEAVRQQYKELGDLRKEQTRLEKQILTTMVMAEAEKPEDTYILARGDYRNRGTGTRAA